MKIAGTYGLSSTAFAMAGMVGPLTLEGVGKAAAQTAAARSGTPVITLKFGAAGFNEDNLKIQESRPAVVRPASWKSAAKAR